MLGRLAAVVSSLALGACSLVGIREVEEPPFSVVAQLQGVEIRQYGPRVAAEVLVEGDEMAARNAGFRKIAKYIFGDNRSNSKVAMTAPVAQDAAASGESIAMTAPVAQERGEAGRWRIRFFMPAAYGLETLPLPNDPEVTLTVVPAETVAVLRFSGARGADAVAARTAELLDVLATGPWQPSGAAVAWFYDPPWTLSFLRRNEVAVPVGPR